MSSPVSLSEGEAAKDKALYGGKAARAAEARAAVEVWCRALHATCI